MISLIKRFFANTSKKNLRLESNSRLTAKIFPGEVKVPLHGVRFVGEHRPHRPEADQEAKSAATPTKGEIIITTITITTITMVVMKIMMGRKKASIEVTQHTACYFKETAKHAKNPQKSVESKYFSGNYSIVQL